MIDVNTDRLAEEHYAKDDPAFETDRVIEEEHEHLKARTMNYIEMQIYHMCASLDDDECEIALDCYDQICEFIYNQLER